LKSTTNIAVFAAAFVAAVPFASSSTLIYGHLNTVGYATYSDVPNMLTVTSAGSAALNLDNSLVPLPTNVGLVTGPPATGSLGAFFPSDVVIDYSFSTSTISSATPTKILSLSNGTDAISFLATSVAGYTATDLPITEGAIMLYGFLSASGPDYISNQDATLDIAANGIGNNFTADLTAPAPEPSSLVLMGTGLMGTAGAILRRLRKA
jgi:hypothetical protein